MSVDELKALGNAAFSTGKHDEAVKHFTAAIELAPENHVLYSNRSAALASQSKYEEAFEDASKTVELKPDWGKGYSRLGASLIGQGKFAEAAEAYERGLKVDPANPQLQSGLKDAQEAAARPPPAPGLEQSLFRRPEVLSRLATDPRTRALLGQPDFMQMLHNIDADPQAMARYLSDDRFQLALQVGLGMSFGAPGAFSGEGEEGAAEQDKEASSAEASFAEAPAAKAPAPAEAVPPAEASTPASEAKAAATKEKELGNAAYKARRFEEAIAHYDRAWELCAEDISPLTNRAAVRFELEDWDGCIADCDEALSRAREVRADYKLVARAMTRRGSALVKKGDLEAGVQAFQKALTEHRNADTLAKLQAAEKALREQREQAYVDLERSAEEKEAGNLAFKEQRYPEAIQHYNEALKRGPASVNEEAYKLFSNRAACYTKLGAWNEGLKDATECIRLKPDFAKGYVRKGHLQFFMKELDKARETYEEGLRRDPANEELREGLGRCIAALNKLVRGDATDEEIKSRQERALADPEVQAILTDPIMRNVLRELEEDPRAAQKHLRHPEIAKKIDKLVAAGIIQMR